jgi:hypothetical protein
VIRTIKKYGEEKVSTYFMKEMALTTKIILRNIIKA